MTIGQTALPGPLSYCGPEADVLQLASSDFDYAVPAPGGTLTSWSTRAAAGPGQVLTLKVFRPVAPNQFMVVATDAPRPLTGGALNTFAVSIPVQAGDVVGLHSTSAETAPTACIFQAGDSDFWGGALGNATPGDTIEASPTVGALVNVEATVDLATPPAVPTSPQATSTDAAKAPVPPACKVPRVSGMKLKAARKALRRANCRLGAVKGERGKAARVNRQAPKAGKVLPPGTKVSLTLKQPAA